MGIYRKNYVADGLTADLIDDYNEKGVLAWCDSKRLIEDFQTQSVADFITELMANCFTYLIHENMEYFEKEIAKAEIIAQLLRSNRAYKRGIEVSMAIEEIKKVKKEVEELREQLTINKVCKRLEKTA